MKALLSFCGCALLIATAIAQDGSLTEKQKIETLIRHVETLKGAKFVRNGTEYDASSAARFLRGKWQSNEREIKTANDFIEKVGTASGTSGKAYAIRFTNGKEQASREFLLAELKKIDGAAAKKNAP